MTIISATPNADNLNKVLAHIEANPEHWNQMEWHCGTSHCFGGWAQILGGNEASDANVRRDARQFLGLDYYEADALFAVFNPIKKIRSLVARFTEDGYDRDGRDCDGYDRYGYNRDCDGYDRGGYGRDGYDRDGYDRDGYDRDGLDANNASRHTGGTA